MTAMHGESYDFRAQRSGKELTFQRIENDIPVNKARRIFAI